MFGQRGGSDAFGRRAVKNIGIRTDNGQTFAETGTTSQWARVPSPQSHKQLPILITPDVSKKLGFASTRLQGLPMS